jgi:OmcA/MtrC family decaheme c-type cytochrome
VLIHGLHASGFREVPYRGWDTERLQFPGDLADCVTCHAAGTYQVPLPLDRVPVLVDPAGLYTTPIAAACGACHDPAVSVAHMESAGGAVVRGDFASADAAVESCDVCHRSGAIADVDVVHAR